MIKVNDTYKQRLLNVNGYFTIPFLSGEMIDQLISIYLQNFDDQDTPFYSSSFHPDLELKKKVNEQKFIIDFQSC